MILLNACTSLADASPRPQPEPESTPSEAATPKPDSAQPIQQTICTCVLRFDRISIEQGLSQSSARAIFQDQRGFIWFGTQDGLNRYDGYNFKTYKPNPDAPDSSISDRWINAIVEDRQGYLWIATGLGGLNRFDPHTEEFVHYQHNNDNPDGIVSNKILALLADDQNKLWVGTKNGLDVLDLTTYSVTHYVNELGKPNGISSNYITAIFQAHDRQYWIGTGDGGLNSFDPASGKFTPYRFDADDSSTISSNQVTAITQTEDNTLWVGTPNGLNRFSSKDKIFARFQVNSKRANTIASNMIQSLHADLAGNLWVGTVDGLDLLNTKNNFFTHYQHDPSYSQSLSHNNIISIYEDRGGVLWFGSTSGINKYDRDRNKFAYYRNETNNPNSISDNIIYALHPDQLGNIWIGTSSGGLNRFNPYTYSVSRYLNDPDDPQSIGSNEVIALEEDTQGNFWIGTSNGMEKFDRKKNTFTHFRRDPNNPEKSISSNLVYAILEDNARQLWIGTNAGLDKFDRNSNIFTHYRPQTDNPNAISGGGVSAVYEDSAGYIWAGTLENGLNKFNQNTEIFTQFRHDPNNKQSISSDVIFSVLQDTQGRLWVGTGNGLNLYHPETNAFTYFLEKDGLPNSVIYGIVEDGNGHLWLSTNFGLSRFNPQDNNFINFDAGDGLQSNEFNNGAYAKGTRGEIYFGGINGLTIFRPQNIVSNSYLPQISLTSLTHEGQPLAFASSIETVQEITLYWPRNSFEFEFAALSYNQPAKNQYAYTLEGFEDEWNYIGNKRDGRYTNLPGGQFTLLLKSSNADGIWNETPVRIEVIVVPPFWQTFWFRILLTLGLGAAIVTGYKLRVESAQNRTRDLEKVVQQRTSELKKRNTEVEALYEADEKILRNVSRNQVFQTLVDVAVEIIKADKSIVLAWNKDQTLVIPRASKGFSAETLQALKFKDHDGLLGKSFDHNKVIVIEELNPIDLRSDIRDVLLKENIRSFVHLPISIDNKIVGIFNVGFIGANAINEDIIKLFTALMQRASLSIANMELFDQTKDLAVMEERNRLARDLHDSAKQKAFAALAQLGTTRGILHNKGGITVSHLNEAENLIYEVIQELTFLIQEIYPIALQEKGLVTILREYIFEWEGHNEIKVDLTILNDRSLQLEIEQAVYRAAQETLANVARHSRASEVNISLHYLQDTLQVFISDNGCGFDLNSKAKGLGLRSMRDRISSVRGTLQIQSTLGQGTRISIQVPIKSI